jgi:hypothetical protein
MSEPSDLSGAALTEIDRDKCIEIGCDSEHIAAVQRMMNRLNEWRLANRDRLKDPDAKGEKLADSEGGSPRAAI